MKPKSILKVALATVVGMAVALTACDDEQLDKLIAVLSVQLSHTTATLPVGATLTLTPAVQPENASNKAVTWASSNATVAKVDGGTITALKVGSATITATTADGSKTAACLLTVVDTDSPQPDLVRTSVDSLSVPRTGGTYTIDVASSVGWNVAADSAWCTVTPSMANGNATITVKVSPNATIPDYRTCSIVFSANGAKARTLRVRQPGLPSVQQVTLSSDSLTLLKGYYQNLVATVLPNNALYKGVTWSSSNTAVATVNSSGRVTAVAQGVATITVTTVDGSKTDACAVRVVPASWASSKFGTVSFASSQTWTVGSQEWSDAVQATGCNKTSFNGNTADCRSNPGRKGDLFSWYAVNTYKSELCPEGWRVPTKDDFVALDIALGGTGNNGQSNTTLRNSYLSLWGGSYGGYCLSDGTLLNQGAYAYYWSQSEYSTGYGFHLYFLSDGYVYPQISYYKYYGFTLRCVR